MPWAGSSSPPRRLSDSTTLTVGGGGIFIFDPTVAASSERQQPNCPSETVWCSLSPEGNGGLTPAPVDLAPVITGIQCVGQSVIDANSVAFNITFSHSVTGVAPADFAVTGLGGIVTAVSGGGTAYTVVVAGIPDANGVVGLNAVNTGTVMDWFGIR